MTDTLSPRAARPCRRPVKAPSRPRRARLDLEQLEGRLVPAVFNVNSLADVLNPGPGVVTLRSAIQAANATPGADTINLTLPGTYKITLAGSGEDANASGDFDILAAGGNLTIANASGGRVVIDGGGLDRVFDVNPTFNPAAPAAAFKVTLQGLVIQHGVAAPFGDGTKGGGGIRDTGNASLELDNCVVADNAASGAGGGILMQNTVNTPWTLTLNNSVIADNHAGDAGGGIDTLGSGHVVVTGSTLRGNTCVNQGAAIWLDTIGGASATLALTGSLVQGNQAFLGATGALGTAGNGAVTITSSIVRDNYSGSTGGGFGDENGLANLTVINSQFLNNTAMTNGGGIQAGGPGTTVMILNSVFAGNTAGGSGGGLFASGGTVTVTGTRFADNTATNGGGIEDQAAMLTVTTSLFDTNRALTDANNAGGFGGGLDGGGAVVMVSNSLFLGNAAGSGGAIADAAGTLTVTNCQFTGNVGSVDSGALSFDGTMLTVTGSTFTGNQGVGGSGAATIFNNANAILTNDTFVGNTTTGFGGALNLQSGGTITLINDTITANTAFSGGGLLIFQHGGGGQAVILQNTIVALNTAPTGPDVAADGVNVTDHGGNFIGNLAGSSGFGANTLTGDPRVGPLENNGGPFAGLPGSNFVVQTEALLPGSPAIAKGLANGAPTSDERGFPRPATPSIGAFEPQSPLGTSPNALFVESVYEVLFNRPADPGAAGFVGLLNQGFARTQLVFILENTTEYRTAEVQALYQRYLHRQADAGGLGAFVHFLQAGGTVEQAAVALVGSQEYFDLHGDTTDGFLTALYEDALNRAPDPTGLSGFSQALAGGMSRGAVAGLVLGSPEYLMDLVESDYQALLARPADPQGLAAFTGALQQGAADEQVLAVLLGSPEAFGHRS